MLIQEMIAMTSTDQITELSERIVDEFHPRRIVLFGSYAWGNPNPDSDVDLLVIMPFEGKPVGKSVEMRLKVRPRFPVDLLVRTPEKIRERLAMGDTFIRDILEQGKVLYEADHG
jgi:predicted nucleotidyltransferase